MLLAAGYSSPTDRRQHFAKGAAHVAPFCPDGHASVIANDLGKAITAMVAAQAESLLV